MAKPKCFSRSPFFSKMNFDFPVLRKSIAYSLKLFRYCKVSCMQKEHTESLQDLKIKAFSK